MLSQLFDCAVYILLSTISNTKNYIRMPSYIGVLNLALSKSMFLFIYFLIDLEISFLFSFIIEFNACIIQAFLTSLDFVII